MHIFSESDVFFRIMLYVLRFVFRILYCGINGLVILSCLYSLSLYRIDLRIPQVIHVSFLCPYLSNLTVFSGMCLSIAFLFPLVGYYNYRNNETTCASR